MIFSSLQKILKPFFGFAVAADKASYALEAGKLCYNEKLIIFAGCIEYYVQLNYKRNESNQNFRSGACCYACARMQRSEEQCKG
jgi:hypothetical protein